MAEPRRILIAERPVVAQHPPMVAIPRAAKVSDPVTPYWIVTLPAPAAVRVGPSVTGAADLGGGPTTAQ